MALGDKPGDRGPVWIILLLVCVLVWSVIGMEVARLVRWVEGEHGVAGHEDGVGGGS